MPGARSGPDWDVPPRALVAIVATVFLWASAFVGIRFAVAHISPVALAVARYLVALMKSGRR